jgi:hypothetical protein
MSIPSTIIVLSMRDGPAHRLRPRVQPGPERRNSAAMRLPGAAAVSRWIAKLETASNLFVRLCAFVPLWFGPQLLDLIIR